MHRLRCLLLVAAWLLLPGYESRSFDECLARTDAVCALEQAHAIAARIEDDRQRAAALAYIGRVRADIGETDGARAILLEILALKRRIMDPGARDQLDSSRARIHALLGETGKALEIVDGMGDPRRIALTSAWIAQVQAGTGAGANFDGTVSRALTAAKDLSEDELAFPFSQLAIAFAYAGEKEESLAIADSAVKLSEEFNSDFLNARILAIVAVAEHAAGEPARSARSLDRVGRIQAQLEREGADPEQRASLLAYLGWAHALTGGREAALAGTESLKELIRGRLEGFSKASQLAAVALILAKAG